MSPSPGLSRTSPIRAGAFRQNLPLSLLACLSTCLPLPPVHSRTTVSTVTYQPVLVPEEGGGSCVANWDPPFLKEQYSTAPKGTSVCVRR